MIKHNLTAHDLVSASFEQITHRMVKRGAEGRILTRHMQIKVINAINKAANKAYTLKDIFNY